MHNKVIGLIFFPESSITANMYLDMLQLYAATQLEEFESHMVFQQEGAFNIGNYRTVSFSRAPFQTIGSEETHQHLGHLVCQTLSLLTFFFEVMSGTKCTAVLFVM